MKLDLERLGECHPDLPVETAADFALKAAHALQRRHVPGVGAYVTVSSESLKATLHWKVRPDRDARQLDDHRATEDGAEAVALSLVHAARGWKVVRRLQRREHADWLLRERATRRYVALEISGTDEGDLDARIATKLEQVARSKAARKRAVCVVGFLQPRISLEFAADRY